MLWFNKKTPTPPEPPTPLKSEEFEKLYLLIVDLNAKVAMTKGELTAIQSDLDIMKSKIRGKFNEKKEEVSSFNNPLPAFSSQGLNTFSAFK